MTNNHFTHYMPEVPDDSDTAHQRAVDHFRLGMVFAVGSALQLRHVRPSRQGADGRGLEPDRGRHRAAGGRRAGDGGLRHHRQAGLGPRGPARTRRTVVAYGLVPIAGAQLCYYNAVAHLSVGVALLLEYTAPVLVVGWLWATTRRRPSNMTLAGVALGDRRNHVGAQRLLPDAHINAIGVAWGLAAAVCAACYFMMSDEVTADGRRAELRSRWPPAA